MHTLLLPERKLCILLFIIAPLLSSVAVNAALGVLEERTGALIYAVYFTSRKFLENIVWSDSAQARLGFCRYRVDIAALAQADEEMSS